MESREAIALVLGVLWNCRRSLNRHVTYSIYTKFSQIKADNQIWPLFNFILRHF